MTGNVEDELRLAMSEHVLDVAAPRSLAHDVVRKHGRRVLRIRMLTVASVAATAVAALPVYNALIPAGPQDPRRPGVDVAVSATPIPSPPSNAPSGPQQGGGSRPTSPEGTQQGGQNTPSRPHREGGIQLGYLPAGMHQDGRCQSQQLAGRQTTTCRWASDSGLTRSWIEVRVVRESGLAGTGDLDFPAPRTEEVEIGDKRGIVGFRPDGSRQVIWLERPGVGVFVAASLSASDKLLKVAKGVKVAP